MDEALVRIRHERSKKDFPGLKLDDDEYVEYAFKRARVCLMMIWGGTALGLIIVLLAFLLVLMGQAMLDDMGKHFLFIILFTLLVTALIVGMLAMKIYSGNKMFITNKHAIQMIMDSPVLTSINIIDLSSVEDASFKQDSLMQKLFNYGTFRLSTVGDETTYTFKYSDISSSDLKGVTKLISAAKKTSKARNKDHKNKDDEDN